MATSFLEQRIMPLGNTFMNDRELPCTVRDLYTEKTLKKTKLMTQSPTSLLHRRHSFAGFVPHTFLTFETSAADLAEGFRLRTCKDLKSPMSDISTCASFKSSSPKNLPKSGSECTRRGDHGYQSPGASPVQRKKEEHQTNEQKEEQAPITTMMIRNVPQNLTQDELVEALNKGPFYGLFDLVYMPCNFETLKSKGYAFVNFLTPDAAAAFQASWHGTTGTLPAHSGLRTLAVVEAAVQGFEKYRALLQKSKMTRIKNHRLRPYVAQKEAQIAGFPQSM